MPVLVEAISVIIRIPAIEERIQGGLEAFCSDPPNQTLCSDSHIVRVGFMTPVDVEGYLRRLQRKGFTFLDGDDKAVDMAVADQQRGFTTPCDWAEILRGSIDGNSEHVVTVCRHLDDEDDPLLTPDGWVYDGSISQTFAFVPTGQEDKSVAYQDHKEGLDVYENKLTGKKGYVGRVPEE